MIESPQSDAIITALTGLELQEIAILITENIPLKDAQKGRMMLGWWLGSHKSNFRFSTLDINVLPRGSSYQLRFKLTPENEQEVTFLFYWFSSKCLQSLAAEWVGKT